MKHPSRRVLAEAAGIIIIARALKVLGDQAHQIQEITGHAADYQQQLLTERELRSADIRRLNDIIVRGSAANRKHVDELHDLRQGKHSEMSAIRDRLAWGIGALHTIGRYLENPLREPGAETRAVRALVTTSQCLREQLDARAIPHVPLSSLGSALDAVGKPEDGSDV